LLLSFAEPGEARCAHASIKAKKRKEIGNEKAASGLTGSGF
jgi:hypothetical protein